MIIKVLIGGNSIIIGVREREKLIGGVLLLLERERERERERETFFSLSLSISLIITPMF